MSVRPIVTWNDPVLREVCPPVDPKDRTLQGLVEDMMETMETAEGVGLAAPQIGIVQRVFVMDADPITEELDEPDYGPMVFMNPEILNFGEELVELEEGCLSIPDVRDKVKRPDEIHVRYLDASLQVKEETFRGWTSRVIQHELDHLDGKLFLDYLSAFKRRLHKSRLEKIDSGRVETTYPLVPRGGERV
ncbi:MAG: peptide deformylase [Balneolaceae bacterium]